MQVPTQEYLFLEDSRINRGRAWESCCIDQNRGGQGWPATTSPLTDNRYFFGWLLLTKATYPLVSDACTSSCMHVWSCLPPPDPMHHYFSCYYTSRPINLPARTNHCTSTKLNHALSELGVCFLAPWKIKASSSISRYLAADLPRLVIQEIQTLLS